jgi:5-methyltetrahydropteroyltriglutamate--homocysteine methyltransferase
MGAGAVTYRAQPIGSMLRPERLKQARVDVAAGRVSPAEFKRIEDAAVDQAVAVQEQAGLDVVSDGEMRRGHFTGSLSEAVTGLEEVPATAHSWHGADELRYSHQRAVTGKLRRRRSLAQEEFVYLRARASKPIKQTLPSPLMMQTFWSTEHSPAAYGDPFEMFQDAADFLREEIRGLVQLGCEYIQIDAPELAIQVDESVRRAFRERGIAPERVLGEGIEIINGLVDAGGAYFGLHLCRGNREGHWLAVGGYEAIAKEVFQRATGFDAYLLEYDDERSGGFEPLAALPRDKTVVLGLISTKRPELEPVPELLARVEEAAKHYPREQLAVSPQCGFASTIGGNPLTEDEQAQKLRLVSEVARQAWP